MNLFKTILRWILGIAALISFLMNVFEYPLLSFLYLFSGVYILPITHNMILGRLGIHFNRGVRYLIFVVTMILVSKAIPDELRAKWDAQDKRRELAADKERKEQAVIEANEDIEKEIVKEKQNKAIAEAEKINSTVGIGEIGFINTLCVGAITEEGYDEMMKLINAGDEMGLDNLVEYGYALQLTKNTKVKVIETSFVRQRIRVISGKFKGASVYLPAMVISM